MARPGQCISCGGSIQPAARKCKHCGQWQDRLPPAPAVQPLRDIQITHVVHRTDRDEDRRDASWWPITAAWTINLIALGTFLIPGWGLVSIAVFATPLWIASFVLACVGLAKGRVVAGALLLIFDLVLFPLLAFSFAAAGTAVGLKALLAA